MNLRTSIWLAAFCAAGQVCAQSSSQPFSFATQTAGNPQTPVGNGGAIQLPTVAIGSSGAATFIITSTSSAQWTVSSATVTGAGFSTAGSGTPVPPNSTAAFLITFTPTSAGTATGTLAITLTNSSGGSVSASFNLSATSVNGVLLSYIISPNGSQTLISSGGTLAFPQTQVNATAAATFFISNRTSSAATLNSVLLLGSAYQVSGVPLLPASIAAGAQLTFTLEFTPTAAGSFPGTLTITVNGQAQALNLTGQGTSVSLAYQYGSGSSATAVTPGGSIPMGSAAANSAQTQTTVTVTNTGNVSAPISGVTVNNLNFTLNGLPTFPLSLPPGGNFSFTVVFAPASVGNITGTLSIGGASFSLSGTGLGPNLTVTLMVGSQSSAIAPGATGVLPNTSVGNKLNFALVITNTGNQPGTVSTLSLAGTDMSIVQPPSLPATIPPGGSLQINAVYAPESTGIVNGDFQVQNQSFGLFVVGAPPPALPTVTFANVTSQMQPLQQPAFGLTLASAYPYDLAGAVTLTFAAETPGDDPNVEFITGTRVVSFQIPANTTQAVFGSGKSASMSAPFQTGSTAGVITLAAAFNLGTYVVTGTNPLTQTITIADSAPVISSVQIASESSSTLSLLIVGYSTPRSMSTLAFQFVPATGATLATTSLSADVSKAFSAWYQSTAGVSFGSQFSVTVQLNISGSLSSIGSVAVSATNSTGASPPVSVAVN